MEGYSSENSSSDKKDGKSEKKAGKAAGLGGRTFELAKKKDTAEKIADSSSIWEKLIPKEGTEKAKDNLPSSKPEDNKSESQSAELSSVESAEEVSDPAVETLTPGEKAEVVKEYAEGKTAELEAGRSDGEEPAEAAAREANIEFLNSVMADAEATPLEPVEAVAEEAPEAAAEVPEQAEEQIAEPENGPAELAHDEAIELNAPTPPAPPHQPPQAPAGQGIPGSGPNFNAVPASMNPNVAPTIEYRRDRSDDAAYFLAGGILGYLLGRRRGRIKTERRMKVVTSKLEKQIDETRQQVIRQEAVIRAQARDRYNQTHSAETTAARTEAKTQPESSTESRLPQTERQTRVVAAERVQRMDHRELLAVAEKIVIGGTSLRTIFEAKQITEPGLRRITTEYLSGGDIKAALKQELQVKEMQYERDPQMRDRLAASYAGVDAAQPQASGEASPSLLAQNQSPNAKLYAKAEQAAQEAEAAKKRSHQVLISAWVALVVVLVIVAVVLALR